MIACYQCKHSWRTSAFGPLPKYKRYCSKVRYPSDGVEPGSDRPCVFARNSPDCQPQPGLITRLKEVFT